MTINQVQFSDLYEEKSHFILSEALKYLKPYQSWNLYDLGSSVNADLRYENMPVITKKELREFGWRNYILPNKDPDQALVEGKINIVLTSGTTEEKVENIWSQKWWNTSEKMSWEYNSNFTGLDYGNCPEAILTSSHNVGFLSNDKDLSFEERRLDRFLYLNEKSSPNFWDDSLYERMRQELNSFQPPVLEVNPTYLGYLCDYILRSGKQIYQPGIIVFSFENCILPARKLIQQVFQSPIASSFGSTETGCVLMECEKGKFHQNSNSCRLDFQPFIPGKGPLKSGRLFVTPFDNPWRTLIRFDIGDIVKVSESQICECGRLGGYLFDEVEGRVPFMTFDSSGQCITPKTLDKAVGSIDGLLNYQLLQESPQTYNLKMIVRKGFNLSKINQESFHHLKNLYGNDITLKIEEVKRIETLPSGKFKHSGCQFPFDPNVLFKREVKNGSC